MMYVPEYGYLPNPGKTWLVVKGEYMDEARDIFANSGVQITDQGQQYLGTPIGSEGFVEACVKQKVERWSEEVRKLGTFAKTQPQAVYAAFIHGLRHR